MKYQMFLLMDGKELEFPVLPEKISIKTPGLNETTQVIQLGEINVIKKRGLKEVSFESFFPLYNAPYVSGTRTAPSLAIKMIQFHRSTKKPVRFLIVGTDLNININFSIEDFEYDERAGEVGDIYFSITLKEWKEYGARKLNFGKTAAGKTTVKAATPKRAGTPKPSKTHTVIKDESLWSICKKSYNDGSKYPDLYAKNKSLIDKRNKGKKVPKYTVYPGQVLKL